MMPKVIDDVLEGRIQALCKLNLPYKTIINELKVDGYQVSRSTIYRVKNIIGISRQARANGQSKPKYRAPRRTVNKNIINAIAKKVSSLNPPT